MISITKIFRYSTKPGRHQGSLSLRVIHARKTRTVVIRDCHFYPEEWDCNSRMIIYPHDNPRRERYLTSVLDRVEKEKQMLLYYAQKLEQQGAFDLDELMKCYRRRQKGEFLAAYTKSIIQSLRNNRHDRIAEAYCTTVKRLVSFNQGIDIPLNKISTAMIKNFESKLRAEGKSPNTICFYVRNLQAIYNKAVMDKYVSVEDNPFDNVQISMQKTVKRALATVEMKKLLNFDFARCKTNVQRNNFGIAQRYFLFSFYSRGMCFVDIAYLQKHNIQDGILSYYRHKTNKLIEVKITDTMQAIMDSFADETRNSEFVFPIIKAEDTKHPRLQYASALRVQNIRLKKLAKLAGVSKKITTHVARHSWASIGKEQKVPLSVISECLGHSSEKITAIYLTNFNNSVLEEANDKIAKALKSKK